MILTKGKKKIAYKTVIYGPEGIGKTTLASKFPKPVFLDTEGSTARMDGVERYENFKSFEEVELAVQCIYDEDNEHETLVIDTFDKLELMINEAVCKEQNVAGIEAIGYGKGYTFAAEKANKFLAKLDALRIKKNINIVVVCHAQMRKFEQPDEMGAYDRWELKLSKKVAPMVKEWADMVFFANYKTYVVKTDSGSKKAQGGKRVMYATHNPCWDAKNRDNLPDMMDFDFKPIAHLFTDAPAPVEEKKEEKPKKAPKKKEELKEEPEKVPWNEDMNETENALMERIKAAGLTEDQVMVTFHAKGKFDGIATVHEIDDWDFIKKSVLGNWNSFANAVKKYGASVPFINNNNKKED